MNIESLRNIALCSMCAVLLCCAGCGNRSQSVSSGASSSVGNAANSSNAIVPEPDYVARYLAAHPPTIKHKDWMQVDTGGHAADPDAMLLYLYSALKHNPKINRCRAFWTDAITGHSYVGVATYDRKAKILFYRSYQLGGTDEYADSSGNYSMLTGVSLDMILSAANKSVATGQTSALNELANSGCARVDHSYSKKTWFKPRK